MKVYDPVKIGDVFSTGSPYEGNLRKYRVEEFASIGVALCRVACGPNGRFYNSNDLVKIVCERLQRPSLYRRSRVKERLDV